MTSRRRSILVLTCLIGLIVGGVLLAGPPTDETLALRRFLAESGFDVATSPTPPAPPGTFVLMEDVRDAERDAELLRWVETGGHLVVADPDSQVLALLRVRPGDSVGLIGIKSLAPGCAAPEVVGVDSIAVDTRDHTLLPSDPAAVACFVRGEGSYLVVLDRGEGSVAILGGRSALANGLLDRGDNAVLALRLFGGHGPIVFGPASPPGAESAGLWSLLPRPAKLVLVEIAVAAALFAVARGRRLGKPVIEEPIAPIAGGELARATAGLYREARAVAFCARLLRRSASERLARRVGAGPDVSDQRLAKLVALSTGAPREGIEDALAGPDPANEKELMALAGALSAVVRELEGGTR